MSVFYIPIGFVVFFDIFYITHAITHWIVSEEGRILAQHDSIYSLKRPYDLVAFLNQEKLVKNVGSQINEIVKKKTELDRKWSTISTASEIEEYFAASDEDCKEAKKWGDDGDLFMNIVDYSSDELDYKQALPNDYSIQISNNLECKSFTPLDFSMAAFPHLQVLSHPWNLTWPKENEISLPLTIKQIYYGLSKHKTNWYLYNLASLHWRRLGDSQKALECIKRAVHFAPRFFKDIPLFNLGVMLHRAQCIAEAAIVLHSAIDHAPHKPLGHFVLANVYALLGDFNRSVASYSNALELDPEWDLAQSMKHSILCHTKVKQKLEELDSSIHDILQDLKEFQTLQDNWLKSHEQILHQQALPSNRSISVSRNRKTENPLKKSCSRKTELETFSYCDLKPNFNLQGHNMDDDLLMIQYILANVESQAEKIYERIISPFFNSHYHRGLPDEQITVQEEQDLSRVTVQSVLEELSSHYIDEL